MKVLQNLKIINLQMMCLLLLPFLEMYNSLGLGQQFSTLCGHQNCPEAFTIFPGPTSLQLSQHHCRWGPGNQVFKRSQMTLVYSQG